MELKKTKIIATIGPASGSPPVIEGLIRAGMNIARLNFSHGTQEQHAGYIQNIRKVASRLNTPVAILQDLSGLRIRTGELKEKEIQLKEGTNFTLTTRKIIGDEHKVSMNLPVLPGHVKTGDAIFIGDGAIKLEVVATTRTDVRCRVIVGGTLGWEKGINVPGVTLNIPSFTDKDLADLLFGIEHNVDFVALSFVREAEDVLRIRKFLSEKKVDTPIIAKMEKREGWENLDAILAVADGIMVARGDLGVEIAPEKVPWFRRRLSKGATAPASR